MYAGLRSPLFDYAARAGCDAMRGGRLHAAARAIAYVPRVMRTMVGRLLLVCGLFAVLTKMLMLPVVSASPSPPKGFVLGGAGNNEFRKDGQRFRFAAGSMHYWRNKPSEWRQKLQLMRNMGLNAVLTPTNWAWHEPEEGNWEFSGDKDFVRFVRTASDVGLLVVLRLGSYATAEMDLGGVPYWMLTKNVTTIRSLDPVWQYYEQRYFSQLLPMVTPLQYPNGPVVCVQIGDDSDVSILSRNYYQHQHDEFRKLGYTGLMNTLINPGESGWWGHWSQADKVRVNSSRVFAGLEFASKDALSVATLNQSFAFTRRQFPTHNPLVDFEYYPGWIDLEGHDHTSVPPADFAQGLDNMFSFTDCSGVSIYMACGGTNFGFTGGGEWEGSKSTGIVSSYDYAAPITEGGDKGPKFEPVRAVIHKHFPCQDPSQLENAELAAVIPKTGYGAIKFDSVALLFENLASFNSTTLHEPQNMEPLGQGYGYILYEANVTLARMEIEGGHVELSAPGLADRGLVYVRRELQGVIGTWVPSHSLQLNITEQVKGLAAREGILTVLVQILVSNEGRQSGELVSLAKNSKGILGNQPSQPVTIGQSQLHAMQATHLSLPEPASAWLNDLEWVRPSAGAAGPAFWKATLNATGSEATFLTTDTWGHGVVFVNGVNIGKFTCKGPSRSLYVPTGVMHAGTNTIVVFETDQVGTTFGSRAHHESSRIMQSVASGPLWFAPSA